MAMAAVAVVGFTDLICSLSCYVISTYNIAQVCIGFVNIVT